ncbi:MAG: class I SAM-dependent methyltransferase [Candidatus Nanoarchaeia archaeon]
MNHQEHYYVKKPKVKYREILIKEKIRGGNFIFKSAPGIFSAKKVDSASKLLAEKCELPEMGQILDLGCGYGVLGISAAKLKPKSKVILTDINKRAVALAKKNLRLNNIKNAEARQGNLYEPVKEEKFDTILLNPPFSAGRDLVLKMINDAPNYLNKKGTLQIVARKTKGGKFLLEEMKKIFSRVEVLAKKGGFWVIKAAK